MNAKMRALLLVIDAWRPIRQAQREAQREGNGEVGQ
jgi:hypothetical protein